MTDIRIHRYTVDPGDVEELLERRAAMIAAIRVDHRGLVETRLIRLEDGTFIDAWRWNSAEEMQAALEATPPPDAREAMSRTEERTSEDGEIVDER